jgi:hypothetical protein
MTDESEILAQELSRQGEEIRALQAEITEIRRVVAALLEQVSASERDFYEAMTAAMRTASEAMVAWEQATIAAGLLVKRPASGSEETPRGDEPELRPAEP